MRSAIGSDAHDGHWERVGVVVLRVALHRLGDFKSTEYLDCRGVAWVGAVTNVVGKNVDGSVLVEVQGGLVLEDTRYHVVAEYHVDCDDRGWAAGVGRVGKEARRHVGFDTEGGVASLATASQDRVWVGRGPDARVGSSIDRQHVAEIDGSVLGWYAVVDERELVRDGVARAIDAIGWRDCVASRVDDVLGEVDRADAVGAIGAAVRSGLSNQFDVVRVVHIDTPNVARVVVEQKEVS